MSARPSAIPALVAIAAAIGGIALVQAPLANGLRTAKTKDDVYALPPPDTIKVVSLGYDAAGADLLWAKLLLEYGSHWSERKYFSQASQFAAAIVALDPKHHALYAYVDALIIYQPTDENHSTGNAQDARDARHFLEEGTKAFPYDSDMWMHYGQFIAFVGPSFLTEPAEQEQWKVDGAHAIAHALDLGAKVETTMAAAVLLGRKGEARAAIAYLQRAYALTDDPAQREKIAEQLQHYESSALEDDRIRVLRTVETAWRGAFPYLTREQFLLMSPAPNPAACAGRENAERSECLFGWNEIGERLER